MTKRKLKPFSVKTLYVLSAVMLIASAYLIQDYIRGNVLKGSNEEVINVDDITDKYDDQEEETNIPVVNTENDTKIIKPFRDETVKVSQKFYDSSSSNEEQENAIIYYEGTYIQNSGVDYKGESSFDVVAILDGTVESIKEDKILGTTIQIKHDNDLVSVYQSMGKVSVKENDTVTQGTVIGQSGEANINKDLGNHLHFELYKSGSIVNPEKYLDKMLSEIN